MPFHLMLRRWGRVVLIALSVLGLGVLTANAPARAAVRVASVGNLAVSVGYAEDKETNTPNPAEFPTPWQGSPNTIFLGGPVVGQTACHQLLLCFDAGAIRLDNKGATDITVSKVFVDVHSTVKGGKTFSLWGSFTVPAGKSVILTENPPGNNPTYDNFDTSGYPGNNCTPVTVPPTVALTIGGVTTTLADSTHVLDTGGIDAGYCKPKQNESIQWRTIGSAGTKAGSFTLTPATQTPASGQPVSFGATLQDGNGVGIPRTPVTFNVVSGPNAGKTGSATTDAQGHAAFTYGGAAGGTDVVTASVTTVGVWQSNSAKVVWPGSPPPSWSGADIGTPALAGSDALSNGVWTVAGAGTDIGGTADQFHFVAQPLVGDGSLSARVVTQTNTNSRAQAGVMLRADASASAPFYAVIVTPQRGVFVFARTTAGGNVKTVASLAGSVPLFLRVSRSGAQYVAAMSSNGTTWTPISGSALSLNLPGTLLAGLAVSSHTATKRNTATFDSVSVG
ncbi:MAG: hypothetical protein H0X24_05870 [Ktedonobacterales bacterium]|nr:hypothetical protein [Ktedonobacterales bacterium]